MQRVSHGNRIIGRALLALTPFFSLGATAWGAAPVKGGTLNLRLDSWPKTLNHYTGNDMVGSALHQFTHLSLVDSSMENFDTIPQLAKSWEIAADKKTMTFHLRDDVTFADGSPVTVEDIKFTYELVYDVKRCIKCEPARSYAGPLDYIKIIDPHTVQIKAKNVHFENIERFGGGSFVILQKSRFSAGDFNKDFEKDLFGAGPYVYDEKASQFRKTIVLRRRAGTWMEKDPYYQRLYNFDKIVFKCIEDDTVAWEAFKKKDLDLFYFTLTGYKWWDEKNKAPFTDKNLVRVSAPLIYPSQWGGIALNMRKGPLADEKFRKALQLSFNRDLIIQKVFQNHFRPVSGPFAYKSKYSADLPAVPYDPKKAAVLLKEAGFTQVDQDGVLFREIKAGDKNVKQRASIEILYATNAHDQWITMYKEDLKKIGVEIKTKLTDWSAAQKQTDEFKFDAFVIGWGGDPTPDPEQLFHGSTADVPATSNLSGLKIDKLDKLIDQAPTLFDIKKRMKAYQEIEKIIVDAQPYIFRWSDKEHLMVYWKDRLDPGPKPFYPYSGSDLRKSFFMHWYKAN